MHRPLVPAGQAAQHDLIASDAELVARAKTGDRTAVVALYQRYLREIYGYVFNQIGLVEEAEDLTSEIFMRFVRSIDDFQGRSSIRTWLYVIARNCLRDRWRISGRRPNMVALDPDIQSSEPCGGPDLVEPMARPSEDSSSAHATLLGKAILSKLSPRFRQVLELRVMEGRSTQDTAEAMETTPGNVKVLQHRALKRALKVAEELGMTPRPQQAGGQRALRSEA